MSRALATAAGRAWGIGGIAAAFGVLIFAGRFAAAQAPAAQPAPPAAAAGDNPIEFPEKSPLPKEPTTVPEFFEAVLLMVDIDRLDFAKGYLAKLIDADPDDAAVLELRKQHGPAIFLRLHNIKELRPYSTELMNRVNAAFVNAVKDPAYVNGLLLKLTGSPEDQADAITELRLGGVESIPVLLKALNNPQLAQQHDLLLYTIVRIGRSGVPALVGALNAPDERIRTAAISSLGYASDLKLVPLLSYYAVAESEPESVRMAARLAVGRLQKSHPASLTGDGVALDLQRVAQRHFELSYVWEPDSDGTVSLWDWEPSLETVAERKYSPRQASRKLAVRHARQALDLSPARQDFQVLYLAAALAAEVEENGWDKFLPTGPGTAHDLALVSGPDVASRVVLHSLASRQSASALAGIRVLAQIGTTSQWKATLSQKSPLVTALGYSDRRVQFAAAHAIMQLDPTARFPGSERIVSIFARALNEEEAGPGSILVIDPDIDRLSRLGALVDEIGFANHQVRTGREGFRLAAERPDVDAILLHANVIRWPLSDTVANLRMDARTAAIPIVLYGEPRDLASLRRYAEKYSGISAGEEPLNGPDLRKRVSAMLEAAGSPPLTGEQRQHQREIAAAWLAHIANGQRVKLFPLEMAQESLIRAASDASVASDVLRALTAIGSREAQERLATAAVDLQMSVEHRVLAAELLATHIQRHGLALAKASVDAIHAAWRDSAGEPDWNTALGGVIGTFGPDDDLVSRRLRDFQPRMR